MDDCNPRNLQDLSADIQALEKSIEGLARMVTEVRKDRAILAFQADWYGRGAIYHLKNTLEHYSTFVREVAVRATTGANVLIMYAPSFQEMMFEFYALVNLCRITMNGLRMYLRPLFTVNADRLPKSIKEIFKGTTDCPIYLYLAEQSILEYLIDLRDCIVHYRSFGTSDNAIVTEEGYELPGDLSEDSWLTSMAKAYFRRIGEDAVSVNVYLPDKIFDAGALPNRRLVNFTYTERWNLLSMARGFTELTVRSLALVLHALRALPDGTFKFSARRRDHK